MYPGHSRTSTRSVYWRAIATVSSRLCESTTTTISSAQRTDCSASAMSAASSFAMTVTESFGTEGILRELMTRDELIDLFRRSGALLDGHFRLSSGLHRPGYLQ